MHGFVSNPHPFVLWTLFSTPVVVDVQHVGLQVREGTAILICEVYGYPRDSFPPKWSSPGRDLTTCKFSTELNNGDRLSNGSISSYDKVVSELSICTNLTHEDEGEYTCSVEGQSSTTSIYVGKLHSLQL